MERSVHNWWKNNVVFSNLKYCFSRNLVFPPWYYHPQFSGSEYLLVQELRCWRWWGCTMWSELGHTESDTCLQMFWRRILGLSSLPIWGWKQYDPTQNLGTHQSDYAVHNMEDYNFEVCCNFECICEGRRGYLIVGGCVTAVMQHSSVRFHNWANFHNARPSVPIANYSCTAISNSCCDIHADAKCAPRSFADGDVVDVSFHGDALR